MEDRLIETIDKYNGKPFPTTPGLARSWATGRLRRREVSRETIYCAELVAVTLQHMGLLGDKRPMSWYDPGSSGPATRSSSSSRSRSAARSPWSPDDAAELMKVANAPLSYGAFEMTVGTDFPVPSPRLVLEAMVAAGYEGTELGPPGYLGDEDLRGLTMVGGFIQIPFTDPDASLDELHATLDLFGEHQHARPVLCDAGGAERVANPGRGGEDPSLRLDDGALAGARRRRRAGGGRRPRARLRAGLPSPHVDLRRERRGDRALLEDTDVAAAAGLRASGRRRRRSAAGARRLGRADRRDPHQGRAARRRSRASRPSAPTR